MRLMADSICKKYNRKTEKSKYFYAVKETDFEIEEGSLTVILGRSGGGKSTLLNMLAGLLNPSSGKVFLNDTDIYSLNDKELSLFRNRNIGVIPQVQSLLGNLSVLENVKLPYLLYERQDDIDDYAIQLLNMVGLSELKEISPLELSGGEMRRVAIARALIHKPGIILADEPTSDLDDENTSIIFNVFRKIADQGTSIVMVTHEAEATSYADVVYRMDSGELSLVRSISDKSRGCC